MKTWNIADYGAHFTDRLQTEIIQKAIDDCYLAGGGRVVIPCGVYVTGDLRLRSGVELYLETGAILKGSRDPKEYFHYRADTIEPVEIETVGKTPDKCRSAIATSAWSNGLIRAFDAENIAVTGEPGAYIDGCDCYDPEGEDHYRGPHGMSFWRCKNIRLTGYTFINSSNWCHAIFHSQNITARDISVYGGHDGFDVRTCDNVLLENCVFNTGDDAVAGFDNNDVVIRNCVLNSACRPLRFGGNNVLVENCRSDARDFGFRHHLSDEQKKVGGPATEEQCRRDSPALFGYYCDHRAMLRKPAEKILIRNFYSAQNDEIIRLEFTGLHRWCCNRSMREITYENVTIENVTRAGMLWGDENEKVICRFKHCRFVAKKGCGKDPLFVAANFEKILFEDCVLEGFEDPAIWAATDDPVEVIRSTPVKVLKKTQAECFAMHPYGIPVEDLGKNLTFKLHP